MGVPPGGRKGKSCVLKNDQSLHIKAPLLWGAFALLQLWKALHRSISAGSVDIDAQKTLSFLPAINSVLVLDRRVVSLQA